MNALRIIIASMFIASSLVINSFGSKAWTTTGKPDLQRLRWKSRTIKIAVSSSLTLPNSNMKTDSDVIGAIRRSIQSWQNVAGIELLVEASDKQNVSPSGSTGDGVSLITIAQSPENVLLFSKNPLAESAKTRVFYNRKSFITEADIVLSPFQQFSTDGTFGTFDLESTLTHEIGHLLGLRHSVVLGSTMCGNLSTNGTFGFTDFGSRTLADSDISAIRELYGSEIDIDDCCATISGKLTVSATRKSRYIRVWAEDIKTGRVVAQVETGNDGNFRLGGLPEATYSLFWQKRDDGDGPSFGELGPVRLDNGEARLLNEKITLRRSGIALDLVGVNSQLGDSSVTVNAGREYLVYLGGKNLDPKNINIEFNSPFFRVSPSSITSRDFGDGISVISFLVTIDVNAEPGVYSIFAAAADGSRASLIGALNLE
ncbi:MAG: matrixin family metalloprotease [Pyrinomonadaceae bacterium]